ncbi:MAG TPA: hypothetical protein VLZ84_07470, partial [Asticcacaulis sp.]|nr:hypothetical protein [Asticcacaulis sp.]
MTRSQVQSRLKGSVASLAFACVFLAGAAQAQSITTPACDGAGCLYLNSALAPEARAKDLIGRMTLDEKAHQ